MHRRVASEEVKPRVLGVPATASSSLTRMGTPAKGIWDEDEDEEGEGEAEGAMGKIAHAAWVEGGDKRAESLRVTTVGVVVRAA